MTLTSSAGLRDLARGLEGAAEGVPPGICWGFAEIGEKDTLFLPEQAAVANALPKRRMEFLAGRIAARRALLAAGRKLEAVPMGEDRAPVWPDGLSGSIAHDAGLAVAVVTAAPMRLGVDIAADRPLAPDLIPVVCRPEERALVPSRAQGRFAVRVFSAKEAAYKAQYPATGLIFGFHGMVLNAGPGGGHVSDMRAGLMPVRVEAEYTNHHELADLSPESRVRYPVWQVARDGLILSLACRAP